MNTRHLGSLARHAGLTNLAQWFNVRKAEIVPELEGRGKVLPFVRSGACAPGASACTVRAAPPAHAALPEIGSYWRRTEAGRSRVVRVVGYVNAPHVSSRLDPGALLQEPVVEFEFLDNGERARLFVETFYSEATAPADLPGAELRAALERLLDARGVPSVSTARDTFPPAVAAHLLNMGLAVLGPARFASQSEPSLDLAPAGEQLLEAWATRAGAPAEAHVYGSNHLLVYDADPVGWERLGLNWWRKTAGARIAAIRSTVLGRPDAPPHRQTWELVLSEGRANRSGRARTLADALAAARVFFTHGLTGA